MTPIRILIADDHAVVRQGLRTLIQTAPDLEVAGEAKDGVEAVSLSRELQPNVVLIDLVMPTMSGLEATKRILRISAHSKVLVLSSYGDDEIVRRLLEAGARGYITKHSASQDLLQAIRLVNRGELYLQSNPRPSQETAGALGLRDWKRSAQAPELSPRETQVLTMIAEGFASKEISNRLGVSVKTIEKHRQSLMNKLDIHEIAGLTRYAASRGLVKLDPPKDAPGQACAPRLD